VGSATVKQKVSFYFEHSQACHYPEHGHRNNAKKKISSDVQRTREGKIEHVVC
jgi:hypothetical protein